MSRMKVAVAGYATTGYQGEGQARADELIFNVTSAALEKSRITRDDIDAVVVATEDVNDGITISNGLLVPAAGAYNRDSVRIETGGVFALVSACASIMSGQAKCVVVSSADAVKFDPVSISNKSYDPYFQRPLGVNHIVSSAMLSALYMHKHHATENDFALLSAMNYGLAVKNPYAHIKKGYSPEEVLNSPIVSWPLHLYDISPISFGASSIVLVSEDKATSISDNPVWIGGYGMGSEPYFADWDDLVKMPGLTYAAKSAYKMACIENPKKEIGAIEVCNLVSPLELMEYEALGFCDVGSGIDMLRRGKYSAEGNLPVNLSGGVLCTNGLNSSGLFRTIYMLMYLRNELPSLACKSNKVLISDSDFHLGFPGGNQGVLILERRT